MTAEERLSEVLSEFARTMVTDFPIQRILDRLVERIVDILPVSGAGVSLIEPDTAPRYVAASDEDALLFERLQSELNEGPCLQAFRGAPSSRRSPGRRWMRGSAPSSPCRCTMVIDVSGRWTSTAGPRG